MNQQIKELLHKRAASFLEQQPYIKHDLNLSQATYKYSGETAIMDCTGTYVKLQSFFYSDGTSQVIVCTSDASYSSQTIIESSMYKWLV